MNPSISHPRIIPAYAGSTRGSIHRENSPRDHPRIRGEHRDQVRAGLLVPGSSPHTRGALGRAAGESDPVGIIPAYAGSTRSPYRRHRRRPDHPRIRGEHELVSACSDDDRGSSPHTRGAQFMPVRAIASFRIIPAYAGSTRGVSPTP